MNRQLRAKMDLKHNSLYRDLAHLILAPSFLAVFLSGCQITPTLSDTPDFGDDGGRFFLHQVKSKKGSGIQRDVFIDKKAVSDRDRLDKEGLLQKSGAHEIEFKGADDSSGLSEIDYEVKPGLNHHLFYCESDRSYHWVTTEPGKENPNAISENQKRLCGE